jgi:hypothetical protein
MPVTNHNPIDFVMETPFEYSEAVAISHVFESSAPPYAVIGLRGTIAYLFIRGHIQTALHGDWSFWQQLSTIRLQYDIMDGVILWHFRSPTNRQTIRFINPVQFHAAVLLFLNHSCQF